MPRSPLWFLAALAACAPYEQSFTVTWATFDASGELTAQGTPLAVERRATIKDIEDSFIGFNRWRGEVDGASISFDRLVDVQHPPYTVSDGGPPLAPAGTPTAWWPDAIPGATMATSPWDIPEEASFSFSLDGLTLDGPPTFVTYKLGDRYPEEDPGWLIFGWPEAQVVLYDVLDDEQICLDPEFAGTPRCVGQALGELEPFDL